MKVFFRALRIIVMGAILGLLINSYKVQANSTIDFDESPFDAYLVGMIGPFNSMLIAYDLKYNRKPVYNIYINSGGGIVMFGEMIVDQIIAARKRGVIVSCQVGGRAMSMAFTILQYCTNRFAHINSTLMQHHMWYRDPYTRQKVEMSEDSNNMMRINQELKRINLGYRVYLRDFIDKQRFFNSLEALSIGAIDEIVF